MQTSNQPLYLNEKAVAAMTGISVAKLRSDRFYGRGIPYCKLAKAVRYERQDVIDYMTARKIKTNLY